MKEWIKNLSGEDIRKAFEKNEFLDEDVSSHTDKKIYDKIDSINSKQDNK